MMDVSGNLIKQYNVKDGMGLKLLKNNKFNIGVISSYKHNKSQLSILKHLNIEFIAFDVKNKLEKMKEWCLTLNIDIKSEVAYMGDDLNDLQVINEVILSGCPSDAVTEVKNVINFTSSKKGGDGCIRDFCEYILNKNNQTSNSILNILNEIWCR